MADELVMRLPGRDEVSSVAVAVVRFYAEPENLAGLSGAMLLPLTVFRGRVPFLPFAIVALIGWAGGRMAWRACENLDIIAQAHRPPGDA